MHGGKKNIKSECDFIGFRNNRLIYRFKECKGTSINSINGLIERFPSLLVNLLCFKKSCLAL